VSSVAESLFCFRFVGSELAGSFVIDNIVFHENYVHVVYYFINKTCGAVYDVIHHLHSNKEDPNKTVFSECLQQDICQDRDLTTAWCTIFVQHSANCHAGLEVDSEGELVSLRQGVVEELKGEITAILIPCISFEVVI
jgi:hypothetical protein